MLSTLLLALSLAGPISAGAGADTTKAPPRTARPSAPAPGTKPSKPAKPVGDPVLKRRHPGY